MEELRHVADGSCSRVFQARYKNGSICAVKKLRVHSITSTWFFEFLQEISILQLLRHPSVVSIERAYLRPLCIVLEWIGGGTLDAAIARMEGAHDWPLLIRVLDDVAQGLHYLHTLPGAPVFHRDLVKKKKKKKKKLIAKCLGFLKQFLHPFSILLAEKHEYSRCRPFLGSQAGGCQDW